MSMYLKMPAPLCRSQLRLSGRSGVRMVLGAALVLLLGCENARDATPMSDAADSPPAQAPAGPGAAGDPEHAAGTDAEGEAGAGDDAMAVLVRCRMPRPEVCTREFRPVCALRDTGMRCESPPCIDATEWVTRPNACDACTDPRVIGHRPGACDAEGPEPKTVPRTMLDY